MEKKIYDRNYKKVYSVNNILSKDSRSRAVEIVNLIIPKHPKYKLKRFGNFFDGGYVLADDLKKTDYLLSFGIQQDISFEDDLSKIIEGMDLYDHSIEKIPYSIKNSRFFKEKVQQNNANGLANIEKILERAKDKKDYILKVDIEGYEWDLFSNIDIKTLSLFRQIVVEFHWIDNILNDSFYHTIKTALEKISQTHQSINVHGNNWGEIIQFENIFIPEVFEVTFLRKISYDFIEHDENVYNNLNNQNNPNSLDVKFIYRDTIK